MSGIQESGKKNPVILDGRRITTSLPLRVKIYCPTSKKSQGLYKKHRRGKGKELQAFLIYPVKREDRKGERRKDR